MAIAAAPEKVNATDEPAMEEGNPPDHIKAVLLGILLLAGAVVLLIFGYLTVTYRRGGTIPCGGHAAPRGWGLPWDLMGDAHPANPVGTGGQADACSSLGYTGWFNVLNSAVAHPHGTGISMPRGEGCFGPCSPFVELPDHMLWLCTAC